jgi:hypothetical protein
VHYKFAQPIAMPKAEFLARWDGIAGAAHEAVLHFVGPEGDPQSAEGALGCQHPPNVVLWLHE